MRDQNSGRTTGPYEPRGDHRCHENKWDRSEKSMDNGKRIRLELWGKETLRRGQK